MKSHLRHRLGTLALGSLMLLGACGDDTPTDSGDPGNGSGPIDLGPLAVFDIALRPQSIQRASSLAGSNPNPVTARYFLTAFFRGGNAEDISFAWDVPSELGTVKPNTDELSLNSATITLENDGETPLGFYDISVVGTSKDVTSPMRRRFVVFELNWMKHNRTRISDPNTPPDDLVSYPIFAPRTDGSGSEEIFYVSWPNDDAVNIFAMEANTALDGPEQAPRIQVFRPPPPPIIDPTQAATNKELAPDLSPAALGRNELLFSSQMDIHFLDRQGTVQPAEPFSLWVVRRHDELNDFTARVLTYDSTFAATGGLRRYYSFDYKNPRWDRSPTGPVQDARIGFLADLGDGSGVNVWLADMRDIDMDARTDTLVNYRRLTNGGSVNSFDWHPDGQSIYYTTALEKGAVVKINIDSGAEEVISFTSQDTLIEGVTSVSVYDDGTTLLAFEALSENLLHLYVYNENDGELTRINQYPYSISHKLFPRWHPNRREIIFVNDYSVASWVDGGDPMPIGNPFFGGTRRTTLPSVWTVRLDDGP